jgi:hypothetical protein
MPSLLLRRLGTLIVAVAALAATAGQGVAMRHCAGMPATADAGTMAGMPGMSGHAGTASPESGKAPQPAPVPTQHQCCNGMPGCCATAPLAATTQVEFHAPSATTAIDVPSTASFPHRPAQLHLSYPTGPPTALTA